MTSLAISQNLHGAGMPDISAGVIDTFLRRYSDAVEKLDAVKTFIQNLDSDLIRQRVVSETTVELAELDVRAELWQEIFALSGMGAFMHQDALREWNKSIEAREVPEFTRDNITSTLTDIVLQRKTFFAQMIDDVFHKLSGEHVTNSPEGFGQRMIFDRSSVDVGFALHTLRYAIAMIIGRPGINANIRLKIHYINDGQWRELDGGALRYRSYKKGTVHVEVHPDIAWRLNEILATLYPLALPEKSRKPRRNIKTFNLGTEFVDSAVVNGLNKEGIRVYKPGDRLNGFTVIDGQAECDWRPTQLERHLFRCSVQLARQNKPLADVLTYLGGRESEKFIGWEFDYDPSVVLRELANTGVMPSKKDHQAYFTPDALAKAAVELADIGEHDRVLEPEAGTGALARHLPKARTICVEVSRFHVEILSAQGLTAVEADFLAYARNCSDRYERIVMNPPYSKGQALSHCEAALGLLTPGGRLVVIAPETAVQQLAEKGYRLQVHQRCEKAFDDASVSVVLAYFDN